MRYWTYYGAYLTLGLAVTVMSIPNPEKTLAAMRFLIECAKSRPTDRIHTDQLRVASGFTEDETRFFFNTLYQTPLFQPINQNTFHVPTEVIEYEHRLFRCSFSDVHDFAQQLQDRDLHLQILPAILAAKRRREQPGILLQAVLDFAGKTDDGRLVQAVAVPWFEILKIIERDPESIYQIDPFKWEEIIAGAYVQAGFDEVVLTPRSGDNGRDVVATKNGIGSIRIFDQVKAYKPGHIVTAEEVRALAGTIFAAGNVSKGVVTTTSDFAPRIETHDFVRGLIPYRIELKNRATLLQWLTDLRKA